MSQCSCRPVQLLFLLRTQVETLPTDKIRIHADSGAILNGIPVRLYDDESAMLADFFVECMEQRHVVAYVNGDEIVRSDS